MEQKVKKSKSRISNAAEKIGKLLSLIETNNFQPITLASCAKGLGLSYLTAENLVGYTCLLFKAGINISLDIRSNEKGKKIVSVVKTKDLSEQIKKLQQLTSLSKVNKKESSSNRLVIGARAVVERLLMQGATPISEIVSISGRKTPSRNMARKMGNFISHKYGEFGFTFKKQISSINVNGQKRSGIRKWKSLSLDIDLEKTKESTLINLGCSQESIEKFRQRTGEKDVVVKKSTTTSTTPAASFVNEVVKSCKVRVTFEVAPENLSELVSRISGLAEFSSETEKSKVQEFIELEEKISKTLNELLNA